MNIIPHILFFYVFLMSTVIIPCCFVIIRGTIYIFNCIFKKQTTGSRFNYNLNGRVFVYKLLGAKIQSVPRNNPQHEVNTPNSSGIVPLIDKGFICCNHRTWMDFPLDPLLCNASIIGRNEAFMAVTVSAVLGFLDKQLIIFNRSNCKRNAIFQKMLQKINKTQWKRVIVFPEGTRKSYTTLELTEVYGHLRKGILLSIYEHARLPIQLVITSHKEKAFNEKTLSATRNVAMNTITSNPIYPSRYETFESFLKAVCAEWYTCWKLTHTPVACHIN